MRQKLRIAELPTGSGLLLAALAISNVSGYVFYVALSRLLSPDRYGALGALISSITIIAVPAAATQTVIARRAAASSSAEDVASLVLTALRGTLIFAGSVCIAILLASRLVERFLHLGSLVPALLLGVYVLVALTAPVFRGAVHGLLRYGVLAAALITVTLVRLALGIPLVAAGWDLSGAAMAFLVAEVCGIVPTVGTLAPTLRRRVSRAGGSGLARELRRATVVVACFSAATNLDVVQVRHYFPHRSSGLYAAASLVGRAVLLASLSITMLVFPQFARAGRHDDDARHVLRWAVTATAGIAAIAAIAVGVLGQPFMRTVFGAAYGSAANVAFVSACASACYSVCGLLMYFHLSTTSASAYAIVPAVAVQTVGIAVFHTTILEVALVTLTVAAGLLAANGALLAAERR